VYVNGNQVYSTSIGSYSVSQNYIIGSYYQGAQGNAFWGYINDFRLYTRAISPAEIKTLYTYPTVYDDPVYKTSANITYLNATTTNGTITLIFGGNYSNVSIYRNNVVIVQNQNISYYIDSNITLGVSYTYTIVPYNINNIASASQSVTISAPISIGNALYTMYAISPNSGNVIPGLVWALLQWISWNYCKL
jgi:hypothetical protein